MITAEYDYTDCKYDPRKKSFVKDIEEGIPEFKNYEERKGEERHNLFAYIVALYDKNSPLWAAVPDYFEKKLKAAETCSLPKSQSGSGGFAQWVRDILESQDKEVNKLIIAYLADMGDIEYTMLISELAMYYNMAFQMVSLMAKDGKIYKTVQELGENIKKRQKTLFGSGEREELQKFRIALYEKAEKDRRKLNPESVVKMLDEEGQFPDDWSPYGKGYEVEELKYYKEDE